MTALYTSFSLQVTNDSGVPQPGALLGFYDAITTLPVPVYSDEGLSILLTNPVECDGFGFTPQIFLPAIKYKIQATTSDAVVLWTWEDYDVVANSVLSPSYFSLINGVYVPAIAPNLQTGTGYNVVDADRASLLTFNNNAGGTVTLPAPTGSNFANKWYAYVSNISTGTFTLSSAANINGAATYTLAPNSFTLIVSTGSTYYATASANYNQIFTKTGGTLIVAANAITVGAFSQYLVDTSSGPQTINTINGGSPGMELVLKISSIANALTLGTSGNIANPTGTNIILKALKDNVLLRWDGVNSVWDVQVASNGLIQRAKYTFDTTSGTNGAATVNGTWTTRPINTELYDDIGIPLASNAITLPIGTYYMSARMVFFGLASGSNGLKGKIRNTTAGTDVGFFQTGGQFSDGATYSANFELSVLQEKITVTTPSVFELQYYSQSASTLGNAYAAPATIERYAEWAIEKVA